jgi:hypothetical protein
MLTWRFSTLLIWLPAPWHHVCAGAFSHPWSPVPRTTQLTGCGKCSGPRAPFCKLFLLATLGKAKWHCVDGPDLTWWFGKVRTRAHGWLLYLHECSCCMMVLTAVLSNPIKWAKKTWPIWLQLNAGEEEEHAQLDELKYYQLFVLSVIISI